jgi:hypothetical protein
VGWKHKVINIFRLGQNVVNLIESFMFQIDRHGCKFLCPAFYVTHDKFCVFGFQDFYNLCMFNFKVYFTSQTSYATIWLYT